MPALTAPAAGPAAPITGGGRRCIVQVIGAPCVQLGSFERHLLAVADEMARLGVTTRFVHPEPVADAAFAAELAERRLDTAVLAPRGRLDTAYVRRLRRLLDAWSASLVHAHFEPSAPLAAAAARLHGIPAVVTRHYLSPAGRFSRHGLFTRATAPLARRHLAVSAPVAGSLAELGVAPRRVGVAPLGVDRDHFRPPGPAERDAARRQLGVDPSAPVVVATSHHRPGKGLEVLVDAVAGTALTAVVAGDGPLRAQLEDRAMATGASVRFTGALGDVRPLLAAADAFCLPTTDYPEGLPMAALEALAAGVPLITTPVPALVEVLSEHPGAGRVVPAGDRAALSAALVAATAGPREAWPARQAAARRATDRYDLAACAARVAEGYAELLGVR